MTNFTTPNHVSGRAVFDLTEPSTASVVVELTDGTEVDAQLLDIEDAQRCIWLAVMPAGATIRAVQATHGDGTPGWRAGRPALILVIRDVT
jgi:hypothetical protein